MVTTIGIDPHKATHTAVAIDDTERVLGELTVPALRDQTVRLVGWASQLDGDDSRLWAIEAAGGLGYLLPQQLIASGEPVVDVPPVLASRVRLLPDLVFTATEGGPIRYTNWRRRVWIPATNEAGLGGVCFHHLRHSHATFLIDAGIDPVRVSRRLGHARISITLDRY